MKSTMNYLGLRAVPVAVLAFICCGCPPEDGRVRFGYWSLTELSLNDTPLFKNGVRLNVDGTVAIYTRSDDPEEGMQWEQSGETFSLVTKDRTFISTVANGELAEGLIFNNGDLTTPIGKFILRYVAPNEASLPGLISGHWKITYTASGAEFGMKLNSDGTVEDSPLGASVLSDDPRITTRWVIVRGVFKLNYFYDGQHYASEYFAVVDRQNILEGRFAGDFPLTYTARFVPAILESEPPVEQQ